MENYDSIPNRAACKGQGHYGVLWAFSLGVLSFLLLAGALFYHFYWRISAELAAYERDIRAQGFPVELAELDNFYPTVPDEENAALIYVELYPVLDRVDPGGDRVKTLLARLGDLDPAETLPSDLRLEVEAYLEDCGEVISICNRARSLSRCRFPLKMSDGMLAKESHRDRLRTASQIHFLAGFVAVEESDWPAFVSIHRNLAHLAHIAEAEPQVTSQLFRVASHHGAMKSLERALNRGPVTADVLRELVVIHGVGEGKEAARQAFAVERCMSAHAIRQSMSDQYPGLKPLNQPAWFGSLVVRERTQRILFYRLLGSYVELGAKDWPEWVALGRQADETALKLPELYYGPKTLLPTLGRAAAGFALGATAQRINQTALAIELFRATHGELPESLDKLVPAFLPEVYTDPFDGAPLRYRRMDSGYTVYSVYIDLRDDQGTKHENNSDYWTQSGDLALKVQG